MFIQAAALVIAIASAQGPKGPMPRRVFVYDPAALEAFNKEQQAKLPGGAVAGTSPQTGSEAKPGRKPTTPPPSYVNISGNFGGVFYVTGVGNGTSQSQTNLINITTNRSVTFSANSFKPLQLANSSEEAMGSVSYTMAIYQGTSSHVGSLISGPVSGTDAAFNGQVVSVNLAQIPSGGNMVLMITRTLSLTGLATGAHTLVGTGYIGVTIN